MYFTLLWFVNCKYPVLRALEAFLFQNLMQFQNVSLFVSVVFFNSVASTFATPGFAVSYYEIFNAYYFFVQISNSFHICFVCAEVFAYATNILLHDSNFLPRGKVLIVFFKHCCGLIVECAFEGVLFVFAFTRPAFELSSALPLKITLLAISNHLFYSKKYTLSTQRIVTLRGNLFSSFIFFSTVFISHEFVENFNASVS